MRLLRHWVRSAPRRHAAKRGGRANMGEREGSGGRGR